MKNNKAKDISTGGLLVGLTITTLYLSNLIPSNTLTFLTLSSVFIPISIIKSDIKIGTLVYVASSILALIIIPIDTSILFVTYFGIYGIIKFFIEKLNKQAFEILLKLVCSNILIYISYIIIKSITFDVTLAFPFYIMIILIQIFILLYDYSLTLLITFYIRKFHNKF